MEEMIAPEPRAAWIAGVAEQGEDTFVVTHPSDGDEVATVAMPGTGQVERAVAAAAAVAGELARAPAHRRAGALEHVARGLAARAEELAEVITAESGKPLYWARVEVDQAVTAFRIAGQQARQFTGNPQRLESDPSGESSMALVRRVPRGPVLGIAPFTFPLYLVAHKVASAFAVGAPIVVKPAPRTPLSALILGEVLAETDLPAGAFSILPVDDKAASELARDPRLPVVSFTGSAPVGLSIADAAARKHVALELGGTAAAVVLEDWHDLDGAARRIATFGNYQAGQSCVAVQRVIVHREVAEEFVGKLTEAVRAQPAGDPYDPDVRVGPVIDSDAAARIVSCVDAAVAAGATLLAGGNRDGLAVEPTLLSNVPRNAEVWTQEVFGPVLAVSVVDSVDEALAEVNDAESVPQTGIFTRDVQFAFRASAELDVGGVVIGDVTSCRESIPTTMDDLTKEQATVLRSL